MNLSKKLAFAVMVASTVVLLPSGVHGAQEADITELEKVLIQKETKLLVPELKLDRLFQERAKFDGMSGWFQGSKKKALEKETARTEAEINSLYTEMREVAAQIQKMVFNVAYAFESKGSYQKAIEYYLKVENRTDQVRFRIANCFKAMQDYQQAIKWLMEMRRTDANLLEVVDCYKLDNRMRDAIYWLFEILEPYEGNAAELTALELVEKYDYSGRKHDYPDFFTRLSNIYVVKANHFYQSNFVQATKDYHKAVELLATEMGEDPRLVSMSILERHQNDYRVAIEMLERQREAAERNFEDRVRRSRDDIDTAERNLRQAHTDAERHYRNQLSSAEQNLRWAENKLKELQSSTTATEDEINRAQRRVEDSRRDLNNTRRNRDIIIRDYLRPYQRRVDDARDSYNRLLADRTKIIEDYIAPHRRKVNLAKEILDKVRALHSANFG